MNKDQINLIVSKFENNIDELKKYFLEKPSEHFFSEKELHSYFYYLCRLDEIFEHNKFFLVHSEFPTPFKCSKKYEEPYFEIKKIESNNSRSHIDIVLFNPLFIDYCIGNLDRLRKDCRNLNLFDILSGVKNEVYSDYIEKFINFYIEFTNEKGTSAILYALEFKYLRHGSIGIKNPKIEIEYDIEKLKNFNSFQMKDIMDKELRFCAKARSLIFCNKRIEEKTINNIEDGVKSSLKENSEIQYEFIRQI